MCNSPVSRRVGLRDLQRFLNVTDAKRALSNPRKALQVLRRSVTDASTTSVTNPKQIDEERIVALQQLFDVEENVLQNLLTELREGEVQRRLTECQSLMDDYPFDLGGAHAAGETLYLLVRLLNPDSICELGVANGVSTLYILEAADHESFSPDVRAIDTPLFERDVREQRGKRGLSGVGGIIPDTREAGGVAPKALRARHGYQYYVGDFTETLSGVLDDMNGIELAFYDASKDGTEMCEYFSILSSSVTRPVGSRCAAAFINNGAVRLYTFLNRDEFVYLSVYRIFGRVLSNPTYAK